MASIDRTAYPRFKRLVSARELVEAFTPTTGEVEWARGRTQTEQHLLALVVRLKSYQRLGYFPKLAGVPAVVTDHVRGALGLAAGVVAETDADRTAQRHRQFVREYLGVQYDAAEVRVVAEGAIRAAAQMKDNPADLINSLRLSSLSVSGRTGVFPVACASRHRWEPAAKQPLAESLVKHVPQS